MKIYANGHTGTIGRHFSNNLFPLDGDLFKAEQQKLWAQICSSDTRLIFCAGVVGKNLVDKNLNYSQRVNVDSLTEVAEISLDRNIDKFIYVSTSHVYGDSLSMIKEDHKLNPKTNYAIQKLEAEMRLINVFKSCSDKLLILRVFSLLDFGMPNYSLGGALDKIVTQDANFILKFASDIRDFMTPKSTAGAIEEIASHSELSGTYNLCTSKGITVFEAIKLILNKKGYGELKFNFEETNSDTPSIVGDNSKLLSSLPSLNLGFPN